MGSGQMPRIFAGTLDESALHESPAALQVGLGWSKARTGSTERRLVTHCVTFPQLLELSRHQLYWLAFPLDPVNKAEGDPGNWANLGLHINASLAADESFHQKILVCGQRRVDRPGLHLERPLQLRF